MLRRAIPALLFCLLAPGLLEAQYFGRNKVQYSTFDFKVIQTEHFDVYYYERERVAAMDAARMAERGYARSLPPGTASGSSRRRRQRSPWYGSPSVS